MKEAIAMMQICISNCESLSLSLFKQKGTQGSTFVIVCLAHMHLIFHPLLLNRSVYNES